MSRLRLRISMSLDGFVAGPEQSVANPLGIGGMKLHEWVFPLKAWRQTHGMGRAVDLCGGVQDFSSPAHRWMRQNAPLYGWFHPSWAAAGGSLPEPWHFEFAG